MRIMAIMAVRNSTMSSEFTMENQCTCDAVDTNKRRQQEGCKKGISYAVHTTDTHINTAVGL